MSNIEKDIEKLESIVKVHNDFLKGVKKETINEREIKAIENVLAERKQDKERIKELEEQNKELMDEYHKRVQEKNDLAQDLKILEDDLKDKRIVCVDTPEFAEKFIPVQKIKDIFQKNRNELFSVTYLDDKQYKPFTMQIDRINKIEKELLEDK